VTKNDKQLSDDTAKAIRTLALKGFTVEQIARMTGVSKTSVRRHLSPRVAK
jgi:DNA-directed RNA polymerase specialized sigma24 family protein